MSHFAIKYRMFYICARFGFIRAAIDCFYAFSFGKFTSNTDLILYTLLILTLRTEPSVNYSVYYFTSEKIYFSRYLNTKKFNQKL